MLTQSVVRLPYSRSFFLTSPPTSEIYTLSLHDALPISAGAAGQAEPETAVGARPVPRGPGRPRRAVPRAPPHQDRKSTRLNSSHRCISYAVFCLKKKKTEHHYFVITFITPYFVFIINSA